ncbi:hypothetical protein [Candidatus Aalborgicola defluviihabitans]|uniref:hypothetical protein n=1 Tax=Candidatus Aalborgicola defluviihabitans TaxID=3386187 RepID=UPI001E001F5E|nr:hypothetical protein [Burkholderiales bacterium]
MPKKTGMLPVIKPSHAKRMSLSATKRQGSPHPPAQRGADHYGGVCHIAAVSAAAGMVLVLWLMRGTCTVAHQLKLSAFCFMQRLLTRPVSALADFYGQTDKRAVI